MGTSNIITIEVKDKYYLIPKGINSEKYLFSITLIMEGLTKLIKPTQMRHSMIITFRVPKELDDTLSEICIKLGYRSKSEFVREAVDEYINYLLSSMPDDEEGDVISVEDLIEPTRVIMI